MFSFFKKDPPKPPPPPPQPSKQQQQQQPQQQQKPRHQDPLIADQISSVFAPSSTSFQRTSGNNNNNNNNNNSASASTGPTGNPRLDRLQAAFGDVYSGEVTYFIPQLLQQQQQTRSSQQQQQQPPPRPIPNGFGELHSEAGGHTYTGYFKDGTRDGQGHLVTARYMIWGFWKENRIDVNSSVRFDSLETLVKYRGFVRIVTDKSVKTDPSKLSTFSIYVAQTNFSKEGWGEAVYPDGRHVFGRWENDELCGFGTQMTTDGERFIGMFHNSKFHGFGVLFLPNGSICEGEWRDGVFKNTAGAITVPNRCVLTGQFTDRSSFAKVSLTLLDSANHSREDVDTGLSFVTRAQYESLFFWATSPQILREEALQLAVPILALIERLDDPMTALATVEKEIRLKLSKTRRFDNALRVAQRVIFFQYGSCGSPSHVRSGCGRATLGILTNQFYSNNNKTNNKSSSSSSTSSQQQQQKPIMASEAIGWCETQKTGGCIHSGSGTQINASIARNLFDDMLSFSASSRKYWATLLQIGRQIRSGKNGNNKGREAEQDDDDDDDEGLISEIEVLNAVSRASFDAIYGACRKLTANVFHHAFYYEQNAADAALERLRGVTLNDVGIDFARQSDDGLFDVYADATRALEQAFASSVPTEILHGLHRWSQCIDSATRESQTAAGSADDLIPIHQFVLLRAKIPHLVPMTKLVSWLGEQPCFVEPTSAESFCLTTLQACVAMLHDLRANIRDTEGVLQSPSALEARIDDTLSLLEDQGVPFPVVRKAAEYCADVLVQLLGKRQFLLSQMRTAFELYEMELEQKEQERQVLMMKQNSDSNINSVNSVGENHEDQDQDGSSLPPPDANQQRQQREMVYILPADKLFTRTTTKTKTKNFSDDTSSSSASCPPTHGRPRGHSISSAPIDRSINEQMLHAVSLLLEAAGCNLVIAAVPNTNNNNINTSSSSSKDQQNNSDDDEEEEEEDDEFLLFEKQKLAEQGALYEPNNMALVSNVVESNKKNHFGIKEAFMTTKPDAAGTTSWVFAVKIPAGLLRSAPQLKIYATKLSF